MRPEVAAFRELDALVRKLTEQLAGYRRRALAAEARQRELERRVEEAEAAVRDALARERAAQDRLAAPLEDVFPALVLASEVGSSNGDHGPAVAPAGLSDSEAVEENLRLRAKLGEARERTALLMERVRFLRQQMSASADR